MDAITPRPHDCWVAGRAEPGEHTVAVTHPADGTEVATVAVASSDQVERAADAASAAVGELRRLPGAVRSAVLRAVADTLQAQAEELAELVTAEAGTPLRWAEREVADAVAVLRAAAGHTTPPSGELRDGGERTVLVRQVARGPVLGVVGTHSPLRSAAHSVAAALAVGSPVVLAPALDTPLSALAVGEALAGTDLPAGAFSVLPLGAAPVGDPRLPVVAGDTDPAPGATAVVLDWPDLADAALRIAVSATREAGRRPDAVHRVVVDESVAEEFVPALADAVRAQPTGDPYDLAVSVGPLPDEAAAQRAVRLLDDAVAAGAKLLTGGGRRGATVEPALVTGTDPTAPVTGPALAVVVTGSADEAFAAVGGAQAGLFTREVRLAMRASEELPVEQLVVGDVPDYDPASVRASMRAFTCERVTVLA